MTGMFYIKEETIFGRYNLQTSTIIMMCDKTYRIHEQVKQTPDSKMMATIEQTRTKYARYQIEFGVISTENRILQ